MAGKARKKDRGTFSPTTPTRGKPLDPVAVLRTASGGFAPAPPVCRQPRAPRWARVGDEHQPLRPRSWCIYDVKGESIFCGGSRWQPYKKSSSLALTSNKNSLILRNKSRRSILEQKRCRDMG